MEENIKYGVSSWGIMLQARTLVDEVYRTSTRALPFYMLNSIIVPLVILVARRIYIDLYGLLPILILYEIIALISMVILFMGRRALLNFSLRAAYRAFIIAGVLGLITGLFIGGVLVLRTTSSIKEKAR